MYKATKAIIMAAGKGKRMRPLTLKTPKPLVEVNGARMIDTVIRGLYLNKITEIYVVTGYLKEQFRPLETEYPGLRLIENPYYDDCNNISSLYAAREHIGGSLIIDGDQMIYDPDVLSPDFERSGYNAVWTDKPTGADDGQRRNRNGLFQNRRLTRLAAVQHKPMVRRGRRTSAKAY